MKLLPKLFSKSFYPPLESKEPLSKTGSHLALYSCKFFIEANGLFMIIIHFAFNFGCCNGFSFNMHALTSSVDIKHKKIPFFFSAVGS